MSNEQENKTETREIPNLIHIKKWNECHNYPSQSMLRKLVFNEKTNGFKSAVRRIGKRVYIHEQEFFKWVDEQNGIKTQI